MPEIHLPVFEGPLDLLLYLIERDDLDITAVSLVAVTDQYLGAIRKANGFEPQALAEFVSIGAKLIYLKSKALLPRVDDGQEAAVEDDDVGQELVDLLREYKRFGQITNILQERQDAGLRLYARMAPLPVLPPEPGLDGVTMDALYTIMVEMLARIPPEPKAVIQRDTVTLTMQINVFRDRLRRSGRFSFRRVIADCKTRVEIIVSFLAILELLKGGECEARQSNTWGDIEVVALRAVATAG